MSSNRTLLSSEPFSGAALLAYLGQRAIPGVESVEGMRYVRVVRSREGPVTATLDLSAAAAKGRIGVSSEALDPDSLALLGRRLTNPDDPLAEISTHLGADLRLARFLRKPALRIPGAAEPFELSVRAVLGQQISIGAARTLATRVALKYGERLGRPTTQLTHSFPQAARLTDAPLEELGIAPRRAEAIRALAKALHNDPSLLEWQATGPHTYRWLESIAGIGPWTAAYIGLRGLGDGDAFPVTDLGLRQVWSDGGEPVTVRALRSASERWLPWRGHAAVALWTSLIPLP